MKKSKSSVWYLIQDITNVPTETGWLSPKEYKTVQSFKIEKRRNDWLLGRWTSKKLIQDYYLTRNFNYKLHELEIIAAENGQPQLFINGKTQRINFSISHSEGCAFCVLNGHASSIGCDIEALLPRSEGLMTDFFTKDEIVVVEKQLETDKKIFITNLTWSAKESVLKVLKEGLRIDTRKINVFDFTQQITNEWKPFKSVYQETKKDFWGWYKKHQNFVLTCASSGKIPAPENIAP